MSNVANYGDSGGIVYTRIGIGRDLVNIAMGTIVGSSWDPSVGSYYVAAPLYTIEDSLGVQIYVGW